MSVDNADSLSNSPVGLIAAGKGIITGGESGAAAATTGSEKPLTGGRLATVVDRLSEAAFGPE
jgi:hypothetical protein